MTLDACTTQVGALEVAVDQLATRQFSPGCQRVVSQLTLTVDQHTAAVTVWNCQSQVDTAFRVAIKRPPIAPTARNSSGRQRPAISRPRATTWQPWTAKMRIARQRVTQAETRPSKTPPLWNSRCDGNAMVPPRSRQRSGCGDCRDHRASVDLLRYTSGAIAAAFAAAGGGRRRVRERGQAVTRCAGRTTAAGVSGLPLWAHSRQ